MAKAAGDDGMGMEEAVSAFRQGQQLALELASMFDSQAVDRAVMMHALAHLIAGFIIDGDGQFSEIELETKTLLNDEQKVKFLTDEVHELVRVGRMKKAEMEQAGGPNDSTGQKH